MIAGNSSIHNPTFVLCQEGENAKQKDVGMGSCMIVLRNAIVPALLLFLARYHPCIPLHFYTCTKFEFPCLSRWRCL